MVIDSSALLAIAFGEPERRSFHERIAADPIRLISAISRVETIIVLLQRHGERGVLEMDLLLARATVETVAVDVEQTRAAIDAFRRFGRGRHPAGLNFGDCFAYALAATTGEPLLFKGDDFARTDIAAA
ncbi:MAG: type II toxin-antitoxin system VapC family toxin [Rhodospirillaceae bacterium]|nr:type II toxin-antitoxin system VapC family toxin [Rhodospirillaceae bacterium]